jgi:hypothetical protein
MHPLLFETADTHHYRYGLALHKQMLARLRNLGGGGRGEDKSSFTQSPLSVDCLEKASEGDDNICHN